MRTALCLLVLAVVGCGAKSALHGELQRSDGAPQDSVAPCAALAAFVGSFAGGWSGVVNCLEEKHASQGTLAFVGRPDAAGNVRIDGSFRGTFFNGKALRSRIAGVLHCVQGPTVDLVDISVGQAQVGQTLSGWLRGWSATQQGRVLTGSWRVDQWDPLCIGAGSWQAEDPTGR